MDLITERFSIEVVCNSTYPVDSLRDGSFIMVACGEYAFWAAGEFFTAIMQVATGKNWKQGRAAMSYMGSHMISTVFCYCFNVRETPRGRTFTLCV